MGDDMDAAGQADLDTALLSELRALAVEHDPVPLAAIAAARSAIAWRMIDDRLAALTDDSSIGSRLVGVRGASTPTTLTFDGPRLSVEIEVIEVAEEGGDRRRLLGQLIPPGPGWVDVRHRDGTATVPADQVGRFSAADVAPGPVSLRCSAGSATVETDWFLA